jgi:protein SCO1/2
MIAGCFLNGALAAESTPSSLTDESLLQIRFDQKMDNQVSPDLPFRDDHEAPVQLGDYFGRKPVILVLGYYECPMLCSLVLNGLVEGLQDLKAVASRSPAQRRGATRGPATSGTSPVR